MSTPQHPHHVDPRVGSTPVAARYAQMHCDSTALPNCPIPPARAPRLIVPAKPFDPTLAPRRVFTTLHYCARHQKECTVEGLLAAGSIKADIERVAKLKWPHGTLPDFDRAAIEWMLVGTPEYRRFLEMIERGMQRDPWSGGKLL